MTQIVKIKISKLKLLENNPRKIDKIQFEKLCKSLQDDPEFLYNRPVLVNEKEGIMQVYAGNQRVRAAKRLGWKDVPCIVEKDIPEDILKSRIVKDNKTYGEFDFDILANDFEMDTLFDAGFTAADFDLSGDAVEQIEGECEEDGEVLEPGKDEDAITKLGDIYELDSHRLGCGDSTDPDFVSRVLLAEKPSIMLTDPPYGIKRDKGFSGSEGFAGKGKAISRRQYQDEWDNDRPSKSSFNFLISTSELSIIFGGNFFADILIKSTHWLVWDKKQTMPSFSDCELAWTNSERKSVKKYEVEWNGLIGKEKERFHPTQKPIQLFVEILKDYHVDGVIFDPFLGSGTALIAAEMLGRKCYGLEISPAYCDIIVNRWIKYRQKNNLSTEFKKNGEKFTELSK